MEIMKDEFLKNENCLHSLITEFILKRVGFLRRHLGKLSTLCIGRFGYIDVPEPEELSFTL